MKGSTISAFTPMCCAGLFWATSVGGSLAYQLTRPIPTSLAIIHSRVYAQALTLAALGMAGLVDVYEHRHKTNEVRFLHPALIVATIVHRPDIHAWRHCCAFVSAVTSLQF